MLAPKNQRAALEWDDHLTGSLRIPELGNCSLVCVAVQDPTKQTSVKCLLGSLSRFVHRSFVTPHILRVRMVMIADHARLCVVPTALCSGFVGRLIGTFCFRRV